MKPRVDYFVHGRGRGHASTALALAPRLRELGFDVRLFGGGDAPSVLGHDAEFREVRLFGPGPSLLTRFSERVREDLARFRSDRPDLVLSDSDGPSMFAARLLGLPRISLGPGGIWLRTKSSVPLPLWGRVREGMNAWSSYGAAERKVIVHFAAQASRYADTVVARPLLRAELAGRNVSSEGFVLTYFSGVDEHEALRRVAASGLRVVHFGRAQSPGVETRAPSSADFSEHLLRCGAVVASAGVQLPAECAMLKKPMLAVFDPNYNEHCMNAALHEAMRIGPSVSLPRLSPERLQQFWSTRELWDAESVRALPSVDDVVVASARELLLVVE